MPAFGLPVPFLCLVMCFLSLCELARDHPAPRGYAAPTAAAEAFMASAFTPASNSPMWQFGF